MKGRDEVVIVSARKRSRGTVGPTRAPSFIFNLPLLERKVGAWTRRRHIGAIADELNARGMLTRRGGRWHKSTVINLLERLGTCASPA